MTTDRWQQIKSVFQIAADLSPAERSAYLDQACEGLPDLRREVESLLASSDEAGDFIERPALHHSAVTLAGAIPDPTIGKRVGPYRVIAEIGSGGMGTVYRAVRADDHFRQQVAIKIVKRGMDTDFILRRFRHERQILASLDHPNIARLLDGGATEDGLPYYVMEYIEGRPIDEYCDSHKLTTAERLNLFLPVCAAVHFAHQKMVVHRDIKPWNILITSEGVPKLLDFGIAKILDPEFSTQPGEPTVTETALRMMTPAYASPEQVRGEVIAPASDVYSLGVLLFELLTGHRPYRFKSRAPYEVAQVICEQEPSRPSTAVGRIEEITVAGPEGITRVTITPELVSQTRDGEPKKLRQNLAGDLDCIVLMAMRKEPQLRYESAQSFATDIRRYLDGYPVAARSGAFGYRVRKWMTRRKLEVAAAAALILGLAGALEWQRYHPPTAAKITVRPSVAVLGFRNLSGRTESAWLSRTLADMLSTELAGGEQLRAISGETVEQVKNNLSLGDSDKLNRETLARIHTNLGADYVVLGSYTASGGSDERVRLDLRLQDAAAGQDVMQTNITGSESDLRELVASAARKLRERLGAREITGAEAIQTRAAVPATVEAQRYYAEGVYRLSIFDTVAARDALQRAAVADPNHALTQAALAMSLSSLGDDPGAIKAATKAYSLRNDLPREMNLFIQGRYYETINAWDKAANIYQALHGYFPDNLDYGLRLLEAKISSGNGKETLPLIDELRHLPPPAPEDPRLDIEEASAAEVVSDYKRVLAVATRAAQKGEAQKSRILVARARLLQGRAYERLGQPDQAIHSLEEAKAIYSEYGHKRGMGRALDGVAAVKLSQGDTARALSLHEESLAIFREIGNQNGIAGALLSIAGIRAQQGQLEAAKVTYREAIKVWRDLGERAKMASALDGLAATLLDLGELDEAKKVEAEAQTIDQEIGDKRALARDQIVLAVATRYEGELAVSKSMFQEAIAIRHELADDAGLSAAYGGMSRLFYDQGDLVAAKKAARDAWTIDKKLNAKRALSNSLSQLALIALAEDDLDGAKAFQTESLALREGIGSRNLEARNRLALAQWNLEQGQPDLAEPLALQAAATFREQKSDHLETVADSVVALSQAMLKKFPEARRAHQRASTLAPTVEFKQLRLTTAIMLARANALLGRTAEAIQSLQTPLAEAVQLGLVTHQFEIRLALGEMEMQSGNAAKGRTRLSELRNDAAAKGYKLIARKAAQGLERPGSSPNGR